MISKLKRIVRNKFKLWIDIIFLDFDKKDIPGLYFQDILVFEKTQN